jgi:hypothetical protein
VARSSLLPFLEANRRCPHRPNPGVVGCSARPPFRIVTTQAPPAPRMAMLPTIVRAVRGVNTVPSPADGQTRSNKPCMGLFLSRAGCGCRRHSVSTFRCRQPVHGPLPIDRHESGGSGAWTDYRLGESADRQRTERSPPLGAIPRAATLYSAGSAGDPDHEAVIRFSSRAPRRRAHSQDGAEAMAYLGSPPPRIVIGSPVATARSGPELLCFRSFCFCSL